MSWAREYEDSVAMLKATALATVDKGFIMKFLLCWFCFRVVVAFLQAVL